MPFSFVNAGEKGFPCLLLQSFSTHHRFKLHILSESRLISEYFGWEMPYFHSTFFFGKWQKRYAKSSNHLICHPMVLCPVFQWKERGIKILLICRIG